jgi:hypothetical protein
MQQSKHRRAPNHEAHAGMAFNRPHSQAPAAMKTTVKPMKNKGFEANKAGKSNASKNTAVITLCLSMLSPEKKAAQGGHSGRGAPRHGIQTQTAMISCSLAVTN